MDAAISFLFFLASAFVTALSGAFFRPGEWYRSIAKPSWQPPDWLFGPVWTVLYILLAVSAWLVWRSGDSLTGVAMALYAVNLALNAAWSAVFFGLRRIGWALAEIGTLWVSTLALLLAFWAVSPLAGAMIAPYLAWATFAGILNAEIWRRNRRVPAPG